MMFDFRYSMIGSLSSLIVQPAAARPEPAPAGSQDRQECCLTLRCGVMGRVSALHHREEPDMGAGVRTVLGDVSGEVAVFGSLNADLTVRTERFPMPGETIGGEDLVILPGGKSANQAVQAGLLGAHVRMIGAVGGDGHGDLLIESLQRAGVDTAAVQREDVATGTAIITVDSAGDNTIVVSPGANGRVDVSTAQRHQDVIRGARVLGLCMEVSPDAVEAAVVSAAMSVLLPGEPALDETDEQDGNEEYE